MEAIRSAGVKVSSLSKLSFLLLLFFIDEDKFFVSLASSEYYLHCPLLCKEFVVDPWQMIYYDQTKGADAVLLIAAILTDLEITFLLKLSKKIGLAALVEVLALIIIVESVSIR